MRAAFIAVGSELLGIERLDTNSLRMARRLQRYGVSLGRKSVIGDDPTELVTELTSVLGRFDLLIVSGGLGPTGDDRTRESMATACGVGLHLDESIVDDIRRKFDSFGRKMPEVNRRQAYVLDGAKVLENSRGTAPGLQIEQSGTTCFLFPGVPHELDYLASTFLDPWLEEQAGEIQLEATVLKVACRGESAVEEKIASAYDEFGAEAVTVLASPGEVRIELWARGGAKDRAIRLQEMSDRVAGFLGPAVFTRVADQDLEGVCGELLGELGATVATAESCTGGWIAQRLTATPGSSAYFLGSIVAYSNQAKVDLLGVPEDLIAEHGAVSREVAIALAEGARERIGSDYAIGVTGIAGPDGGSEEKPVGTVHVAVAGPRGSGDLIHQRAVFPGDREKVRRLTSQLGLELLRRRLLDPNYRPGGW
ncbi:MAG: CinA family nicotinamide mononucleotide deamidase-related protein [Thermoanaerobaculia bacterium]|nr:CinA family nicotinamide mononucleotide deamidase-related protein [Thermoanaerobaculia bacterium]